MNNEIWDKNKSNSIKFLFKFINIINLIKFKFKTFSKLKSIRVIEKLNFLTYNTKKTFNYLR